MASQPEQLAFDPVMKLSFTGHQTFSFRYSWLPKGVQGIKDDDGLFFREDALVQLGVGKNMVGSIRFWCEALELIEVDGKAGSASLLPLGGLLFGRDLRSKGYDPYLEDPGTLWLLHWQLASKPQLASTWHLAFTRWGRNVFTRDQLVDWIFQTAKASTALRSSINSIRRDVDVFLRTYIPVDADRRRPIEDSFDCPLGELGLLRRLDDGYFQFVVGPKPSLPLDMLAYAILEFWNGLESSQKTLNVERLLYDPGSPGAAFKLDDRTLVSMLERLSSRRHGLRYDETAGLRVLLRTSSKPFQAPLSLIDAYYRAH